MPRLLPRLLLLSLLPLTVLADTVPIEGWRFRSEGRVDWKDAAVPGCVQTDLMRHGLIEDPHKGENETKAQWVHDRTWEYKTSFQADATLLAHDAVELEFQGLATRATVWLNGKDILHADNLFRDWRIPVREILKPGANELRIIFDPLPAYNAAAAAKSGTKLPDDRVFTRHAPYQFGWDWAPRLIMTGPWKPVLLHSWDGARLLQADCQAEKISDAKADMLATAEIDCSKPGDYAVEWRITAPDGTALPPVPGTLHCDTPGIHPLSLRFPIAAPALWYPAGQGPQPLYKAEVTLSRDNTILQSRSMRIGLRTVELVRQEDDRGQTFYFKVNGKPLFAKGANYVPMDSFPHRVTSAQRRKLLANAADANMNMLRIWGGGIYEADDFYDACDELGILVWQDFMYACALYPGDDAFIANAAAEAAGQVRRLRQHPCIALWCGNNEVLNGWMDWGWQDGLSPSQRNAIGRDYARLFESALQRVVTAEGRGVPYHATSPTWGWGHRQHLSEGDSHYWGVWWGKEPFDDFKANTGRFMSEYGFQGMPDPATVREFAGTGKLTLASPVLRAHQKHPTGFETIQEYLGRDFATPVDFDAFAYVTQVLQAEGMKIAMERHRFLSPYCMGSLYWQLNDSWPVTSWSGIDHAGRAKALHHQTRRSFAPVLPLFDERQGQLEVRVANDRPAGGNFDVTLETLRFDGHQAGLLRTSIHVPAGGNEQAFLEGVAKLMQHQAREDVAFVARIHANGRLVATNIHYPARPKHQNLPGPGITTRLETAPDGTPQAVVSTRNLARAVRLTLRGCDDASFADNYFDLLPGETRTVRIRCKGPLPAGTEIETYSLHDAFPHAPEGTN